jgi:hypothetical protein
VLDYLRIGGWGPAQVPDWRRMGTYLGIYTAADGDLHDSGWGPAQVPERQGMETYSSTCATVVVVDMDGGGVRWRRW